MRDIEEHTACRPEPAPTPGNGRPEPGVMVVLYGLTPTEEKQLSGRVSGDMLRRLSAAIGVSVVAVVVHRRGGRP